MSSAAPLRKRSAPRARARSFCTVQAIPSKQVPSSDPPLRSTNTVEWPSRRASLAYAAARGLSSMARAIARMMPSTTPLRGLGSAGRV